MNRLVVTILIVLCSTMVVSAETSAPIKLSEEYRTIASRFQAATTDLRSAGRDKEAKMCSAGRNLAITGAGLASRAELHDNAEVKEVLIRSLAAGLLDLLVKLEECEGLSIPDPRT